MRFVRGDMIMLTSGYSEISEYCEKHEILLIQIKKVAGLLKECSIEVFNFTEDTKLLKIIDCTFTKAF